MTGALVATMLTGCGSSSDAGSSSGAGSSSEAGGTTDLSKVELTVGTSGTYAPFSYFKEDGKTYFFITSITLCNDIPKMLLHFSGRHGRLLA